jgi:hypothetical protein
VKKALRKMRNWLYEWSIDFDGIPTRDTAGVVVRELVTVPNVTSASE